MQETPVRCLRWEDPLPKGESYDLACRTPPQGRKASDRTVCACVRACVHARSRAGLDLWASLVAQMVDGGSYGEPIYLKLFLALEL